MSAQSELLLLSFVLEAALVVAVMARRQGRVAGRFPLFTAFLGFEALRSLIAVVLSVSFGGRLAQPAGPLLAAARLALEAAVAWELYSAVDRLRRPRKPRSPRRQMYFAFALAGSAVVACLLPNLLKSLPASFAAIALHRGELFSALLMLAVFALSPNRLHRSESGRMMQGFAAISVAQLVAQAATASGGDLVGWTLAVLCVTVLVLVFWLWRFTAALKQVSGPAIGRAAALQT